MGKQTPELEEQTRRSRRDSQNVSGSEQSEHWDVPQLQAETLNFELPVPAKANKMM